MTTVRFFAAAEDAVGAATLQRAEPTLGDLRASLELEHPALVALLPRCAVLVDGARVDDTTVLAADAIIAVLPPFAGG